MSKVKPVSVIALDGKYIVKVPGVLGNAPHIFNSMVTVAEIARLRLVEQTTTGDIIRMHPGLHKKAIQAALRYYKEHPNEFIAC